MHKIKKGDLVKVITGKDKDKTGKVLSVNVKKNTVLVEGCNMVTKHTKPSAANQQGGIIHQEGALDISNVYAGSGWQGYESWLQSRRRQEVRVAKATGK